MDLILTVNEPQKQACGVGAKTRVRVGRSRPLWPETESQLLPIKHADSGSSPEPKRRLVKFLLNDYLSSRKY